MTKKALCKVDKKFGQDPPPPPHFDKIQKNSYFFSGDLPLVTNLDDLCIHLSLALCIEHISTESRALSTTTAIPWGSVKVGELLMLWTAVATRDLRSSESEGLHCHHQQQPRRCQILYDHNQPRRFPAVLLGQIRTLTECST